MLRRTSVGVFKKSAPVREGDNETVVCQPVTGGGGGGLAGCSSKAKCQFDIVGKAF